MKYLEFLNQTLGQHCKNKNIVIYGQNVNNGSRIDGLTRGVESLQMHNSTNCENTLVGMGFGMMIEGQDSIFFMKQTDFILLGIDHLVNTYNNIRVDQRIEKGSFTVFPITVDADFQGPQSSLNNISDICSLANIPGYTVTTQSEIEFVVQKVMPKKDCKIVTVSKRLFAEELITQVPATKSDFGKGWVQYSSRQNVEIALVCFNFSLPYGLQLQQKLRSRNIEVGLYNVFSTHYDESSLERELTHRKIVLFDDSKSRLKLGHRLRLPECKILRRIEHDLSDSSYAVRMESLQINFDQVVSELI